VIPSAMAPHVARATREHAYRGKRAYEKGSNVKQTVDRLVMARVNARPRPCGQRRVQPWKWLNMKALQESGAIPD
jgi:hypothetical protein